MENENIRQLLFDRYIRPTMKKKKCYVGIEIEMPIVNLAAEAVDFNIIHNITREFISQFDFTPSGIDEDGNIYAAEHKGSGDILSYDCSYNNLELSFGKECCLFSVQDRFYAYYSYLNDLFGGYNYTLTGMGVNPYRIYNHNVPIPNGRYRMLYHHLHSYTKYSDVPMYFHSHPEFGTFSSASQVQLDAEYDSLVKILNVFSKLEPIKALLFSNSVLLGEREDILCCRDMLWENSTHGINPHNVGMFGEYFDNADDILTYLETTSIYCVERGDKYINFPPVNICDYLKSSSVKGEYYDKASGEYREIEVEPSTDDIKYLRTFKFEDLTYRGTVEFRSVCCQPIRDVMTVAAFHSGAMERVDELDKLLDADRILYNRGYTAAELRKQLVCASLPEYIDVDGMYALAGSVLEIISDGLRAKGDGEEVLLAPLYDRVKNRTNPAKHMLTQLADGVPIESIIKDYAKLI